MVSIQEAQFINLYGVNNLKRIIQNLFLQLKAINDT